MSLSSLLIIFSSSFMALFPVINPLGNGFVVNGFFANLDPSQRKTAIQKLTINFIMIGVGTVSGDQSFRKRFCRQWILCKP